MKQLKNIGMILSALTAILLLTAFSAGAQWQEYQITTQTAAGESGEETPRILSYRYSFDDDTGVLVLAPGQDTKMVSSQIICRGENDKGLPISPKKIQYLILQEGFISIFPGAFRDLRNLTQAIMPEGLEILSDSVFFGCSNLKTIALPQSLEYIGREAFGNCASLRDFILPESVQEIGDDAFIGCHGLKKVHYSGQANLDLPGNPAMPEKIKAIGSYVDGSGNLVLTWAGNDDEREADYYRVYQYNVAAKRWDILKKMTPQRSYTVKGLKDGQKYKFAVRPINESNGTLKYNDYTSVTLVKMAAPTLKGVSLTGGYQLTWNQIPGAMGYQIWYSSRKEGSYRRYKNCYDLSFTKTGLKKGTAYYIKVRAVADLGGGKFYCSDFSAPVKVTVR